MSKDLDIISEIPLFKGLPETDIDEIKKIAAIKKYKKGRS